MVNQKKELTDEEMDKLLDSGYDLEEEENKFKEGITESYYNITDILKEYLDLNEEYYNIIALWIIGTYFHNQFPSYPYLFLNAMKGSGKSRALRLITSLAKDGEMLNSMTEAVLFRTSGALAIDEYEGVTRKGNEALRELLNSAYKRGTKVKRMRQKKTSEGTEQVVEEFNVYRPVVLANIWGMENVLGDRCITLILEKSNRKEVTNLIEIFDEEEIVQKTKEILNQCSKCSYLFSAELYRKWNEFIKNNYTNYIHYTNNTNSTNNINPLEVFKTLKSMDLNGRDLELSLPLCLIASLISTGNEGKNSVVLKITTLTFKHIFSNKNEEEIYENIDISLYDFIASELQQLEFYPIKQLTQSFKDFIGSDDDWINSKWMGRALKRLNLKTSERRVASGMSVMLNIVKAKDKMRMFK